jgi:hypothetical protein
MPDLIGRAAWLHRQARRCQAIANSSADPKLAELALDDADRFQRASDIVKKAADERRKRRTLVINLDSPTSRKVVPRETRRRGRVLVSDHGR